MTTSSLPSDLTFAEAVDRYGRKVYGYLLTLTYNQHEAEDYYQDTLLKAFRAWNRLPLDANHLAWLITIAKRTFISARRVRRVTHTMSLEKITEEDNWDFATPEQDIDAQMDARNVLERVQRAIQALPPKQRTAFIRRRVMEEDYSVIAAAMECSEAAVRRNVFEASRRLLTA
jgi:RNA polymerase sigma-70 factor (ECF subfamily)